MNQSGTRLPGDSNLRSLCLNLIFQATEDTEEHRSSVVVVNIPIAVTTGGEYVSFTSMDAHEDTQYVGYPGFIPLQNSAPMPITRGKTHIQHIYFTL